mmetsp:Transcript_22112/g.44173  ORF Transcript_22112/g.44173 Transcript_22112/m.44173 type:complete len:218 (+) Transcript_22112:333-986(+)
MLDTSNLSVSKTTALRRPPPSSLGTTSDARFTSFTTSLGMFWTAKSYNSLGFGLLGQGLPSKKTSWPSTTTLIKSGPLPFCFTLAQVLLFLLPPQITPPTFMLCSSFRDISDKSSFAKLTLPALPCWSTYATSQTCFDLLSGKCPSPSFLTEAGNTSPKLTSGFGVGLSLCALLPPPLPPPIPPPLEPPPKPNIFPKISAKSENDPACCPVRPGYLW